MAHLCGKESPGIGHPASPGTLQQEWSQRCARGQGQDLALFHPGRFLWLGNERQSLEVMCAFSTDTCIFPACLFSFFNSQLKFQVIIINLPQLYVLPLKTKETNLLFFTFSGFFFFFA